MTTEIPESRESNPPLGLGCNEGLGPNATELDMAECERFLDRYAEAISSDDWMSDHEAGRARNAVLGLHRHQQREIERLRALVLDYAVVCGELSKGMPADAPEWAALKALGDRIEGPNVRAKLAPTAWRAGQHAHNGPQAQRMMASATSRWGSA